MAKWNMLMRDRIFAAAAVLSVVAAYLVLASVTQALKVKAGIAEDTGTAFDPLALAGCLWAASAIAGSLASRPLCASCKASLAGMLLCLVGCFVWLLQDRFYMPWSWFLVAGEFGDMVWPVTAWTVLTGGSTGWAMSSSSRGRHSVRIAIAVFAAALLSLWLIYYPAECFFVSVWENG